MPPRPPSNDSRLEKAAACLSPLERRVLELSAAEGLDNGAIAARLGISPRRVERLLARALVKFDRALEPQRRPWWRLR